MARSAFLNRGEIIVDNFAGGGGASLGIKMALGRAPDIAINHNAEAIAMHAKNHPETVHMTEDVWKVNPRAATKGRKVGLLWASPDCRHFSRAKGAKPVDKKIRSLAWVVIKWAAEVKPRIIILENVREFADWGPIVPAWKCQACKWRGTEGQARLVRTRRRCPSCDSLKLAVSDELIPDPDRKGLTFKRWAGRLRTLGYQVEYKNLNAADYGAPTHRRRLFLIARCDGQPIVWPDPTHGDPAKLDALPLFDRLQPWRTAAECIDWSIPCPSIFDRKKPLAEATMKRIALGIKRYVIEAAKPFIVGVGGRMGQSNASPVDGPNNTVTSKNDRAIVTPYLVQLAHGDRKDGTSGIRSNSIETPLGTVQAGGNNHAVVAPILVGAGGSAYQAKPKSAGDPLNTVTKESRQALVTAFLAKHFGGVVGHEVDRPLGTVTSVDHHSLVAAHLTKFRGDSDGQPIDKPMPTVTSGAGAARPAGAPHALAITAANLIHMNHGGKQWSGCDDPMYTVTSKGLHAALVYSFLVRYFGTAIGQHATEPLYTITGKDRFGLVTVMVDGEPYIIADIGMRMLAPRELARAQGFTDDYILTGTKTSQVARIGNSVCPMMAKVLVEANLVKQMASAA